MPHRAASRYAAPLRPPLLRRIQRRSDLPAWTLSAGLWLGQDLVSSCPGQRWTQNRRRSVTARSRYHARVPRTRIRGSDALRAAVRALVSVEPMCLLFTPLITLSRRHPPHACACLSVRNGAEHGTETVRSQVTQARPPCEASECARNIACPFARLGNVRPHLCAPVCAPPAVRPRLCAPGSWRW